jgi:hypothetical protein
MSMPRERPESVWNRFAGKDTGLDDEIAGAVRMDAFKGFPIGFAVR